jgi:hypothetical protein
MFLKIKGALFASNFYFLNFFKKISSSIIKVFFAVIKNPMFTVFCKLVFFTATVVIVNPNILVPFSQKLFFYESIVNSCDFFYHSALLYFSSLTAVYSDTLQLKPLVDLLHRRLNELTDCGTNLSKTLGEVIQKLTKLFSLTSSIQNSISIITRNLEYAKNDFVRSIGELFSLTSSIQNSVSILTRDLESTKHKFVTIIAELFSSTSTMKNTIISLTRDLRLVREELSKTAASLEDLNTRFIQHRLQSTARFSAMQKILENVKAPIVGTSTANQILNSKTVSNIRPR